MSAAATSSGPPDVGRFGYPPVPAPGGQLDPHPPSAPPLPVSEAPTYGLAPASSSSLEQCPAPPSGPTKPLPWWAAPFGRREGRQEQKQQLQPEQQKQQQHRAPWYKAPAAVGAGGPAAVAAPAAAPGVAIVAAPKLEPQPWVKSLWRGAAAGTVGVARVDLRRPT